MSLRSLRSPKSPGGLGSFETFAGPVRRCLAVAALCVAAAPTQAASPTPGVPYTGLYVFGDSLSDNGNLFKLTGGAVPDPALYPSNGRFSNGPVAVEYLASRLGLGGQGQFFDYAIAGARTGNDGQLAGSGLRAQVNGYLSALGNAGATADPNALYVVWGGANDLLQPGLANLLTDPVLRATTIATAIGNLVGEVSDLYAAGARNFLLVEMPDLGKTPRAQAFGGQVPDFVSAVAGGFNAAFVGAFGALAASLPDESFTFFDTFAATNEVRAQFADPVGLCIGTPAATAGCPGLMFFDDIHPTTATHALLADRLFDVLAVGTEVPEPSTTLLLALAAAALGAASARRRAQRDGVEASASRTAVA